MGLAARSAADWERRALMLPRGADDRAALDSVRTYHPDVAGEGPFA